MALQLAQPADEEVLVLADQPIAAGEEINKALALLLLDQQTIQPREPLGLDLGRELLLKLDLTLRAELTGDDVAGPVAYPMGDVVARYGEGTSLISDASYQHMGVGMAAVVMIDGNPVEPGAEIALHLSHVLAGEASEIAELPPVFRRDDEAELVAVLAAALQEGLAIGLILERRIAASLLPVGCDPVALEIAQMSVDRLGGSPDRLATATAAHDAELHYPRLHHHAARAMPFAGIDLPTAIDTGECARCPDAAAAGVVTPAFLPA